MYSVDFTFGAGADLARLDTPVAERVIIKLRWLADNFDTLKPEVLTGEWHGVFKLRVGDYRILYTFDKVKRKIIVHFVRHRCDIYKIK